MEVKHEFLLLTPSGASSPHQKVVEFADGGRQFISYGFLVAEVDQAYGVRLSEHWNCSRITERYLLAFLGIDRATLNDRIARGVYAIRKGPAPVIRKKGA